MNSKDLDTLILKTQDLTTDLLIRKGAEYSSDTDRLENFKRNAELQGLTPLQVWNVYWSKHIDAIHSYMRRIHGDDFDSDHSTEDKIIIINAQLSEPIEGRFHDAINYLHLGLALLEEARGIKENRNSPEAKPWGINVVGVKAVVAPATPGVDVEIPRS